MFVPKGGGHGQEEHAEPSEHGAQAHAQAQAEEGEHGHAESAGEQAAAAAGEHASDGDGGHGSFVPPIPWVVPFIAILLVVAIFPLLPKVSHWWEHNRNRLIVSVVLGTPVVIYILMHESARVEHSALEYFQFLSLLGGLFITAGGIHISGDLRATPTVNSIFMLIGYLLASVIGTTGAAMLLIFPLLRTNLQRKLKMHSVIFFIFLVCNTGGLLSPIGDPPLFLGYLRGIDFFWFLKLLPLWIVNGIVLFAVYYALDLYYYRKEAPEDIAFDDSQVEPLRFIGPANAIFLLAIVVSVAASVNTPYREAVMYLGSGLSLIYADRSRIALEARQKNQFNFHAILEVAAVFAGIFATMMPALMLLRAKGADLGIDHPLEFFYATGIFSSFLDNAPTFLVFLELGLGVTGLPEAAAMQVGDAAAILGGISAGAVFMGANTYIGNAPNFMVRSIAEEQGVKMPSFFGYMLWAAIILLPVFTVIAVVFFTLMKFPMY